MRLLKLVAYGALGYLLYEFFNGLVYGSGKKKSESSRSSSDRSNKSDLHRALNEDQGRTSGITGGGSGQTLRTEDSYGTSVPHKVGRGVIHR